MEQPLISIITVIYNAEEVLEPTLRSVEEQSFGNYEHIIIDGHSTDGTLSIVARHLRPQLQLHSKSDNGIYHGMNRGLKHSKGKYVLFLNAGDRLANKETLAKYAAAAEDNPDIIYGDTIIIDNEGNLLRPRHLSSPDILTYGSYLKGMLICHQAFMVRREIAPEYSREFKLSADYDWCLACIEKSGVSRRKNLRCVTIHYLDGGMSEKKKWHSLKERFIIMKRRFGLGCAVKAHISFIPRALIRKFK